LLIKLLGTWQSEPGQVQNAVFHGLSVGYKHIDCAYCYGNEDEIGAGLAAAFKAGVKREDIFVTTKLWCTYHRKAELGLEKSLKSLGLDYVDLFLMHWPVPMNPDGESIIVEINGLSYVSQVTTTDSLSSQMTLVILTIHGHMSRPGRS